MKEGLHFNYDGIDSSTMGLINVQVDTSGFFEEPFVAEREIIETRTRMKDRPYFHGVSKSPLTFSLSFAFLYPYDSNKIREVARWLDQDTYKPFYTYDNPGRIFYCMLHSSSTLLHNGLKQGYVNVEFRCDAPYSYSPVYISELYELINNPTGTEITFENHGDLPCKPEVWIEKIGNGDVSIINISDGNVEFKFTGLVDGETVYVDNENEYIATSLPATYRYNNFNNVFLELPRGVNKLVVVGSCNLQFRYRFKTLQG